MKIHYAAISETGKHQNNEDAFRIVNSEDGSRWLAVVCDGSLPLSLISMISCAKSRAMTTDDKPRAMSNLFEHGRGAKEEGEANYTAVLIEVKE